MEICQSQTGLQGITLYSSPKRVTRKVRPTTDILHASTQCTRLSQHRLHKNYSLTPTLMISGYGQKGHEKREVGCVDCLLLDQTIGLDAKITSKPLGVARIDYEKAYDRVPHKWVMKVLKTIKCPVWIRSSIELFSKHWATLLELRTAGRVVRRTPVKYNRGFFQGDSLSPLLFCPSITPISQVLNRTKDIPSGKEHHVTLVVHG